MVKAIWNDVVIAESDDTVIVEGNHYFPISDVKMEFFNDSSSHTRCLWKSIASYYTIAVGGKENQDAAWYYSTPSDAAKMIKDHIAFWRGVKVVT